MIVIASALFGVALGIFLARKNGGNVLDKAQYATASAIAFALVGLVITVVIHRMSVG